MIRCKILLIVLVFTFTGCASAPHPTIPSVVRPPPGMAGSYHKVQRQETLWRISKNYNVDLDELIRINHIPDVSSIEVGQLIFIPKPALPQKPPLTYTRPSSRASEDFIWPLKGRISSAYGTTVHNMVNKGINIAPSKSSDVLASRSGKVVFCENDFLSFGKTIIIDHHDGFSTLYARNDEVFVKVGDIVEKGSVISKAGRAGRDKSTYLHFEIRKGSSAQNPLFYLPK